MKTEERNKAVVMRFNKEFIENGNDAVFDKIIDKRFVCHSSLQETPEDRETFRNFLQGSLKLSINELKVSVYDMIAEGDKVVLRKSYRGILKSDMLDVDDWYDMIEIMVMEIIRLKNGKIVECWTVMDSKDVAVQAIAEEHAIY